MRQSARGQYCCRAGDCDRDEFEELVGTFVAGACRERRLQPRARGRSPWPVECVADSRDWQACVLLVVRESRLQRRLPRSRLARALVVARAASERQPVARTLHHPSTSGPPPSDGYGGRANDPDGSRRWSSWCRAAAASEPAGAAVARAAGHRSWTTAPAAGLDVDAVHDDTTTAHAAAACCRSTAGVSAEHARAPVRLLRVRRARQPAAGQHHSNTRTTLVIQ
jgi:hypothetical protein